MRLPRSACGLFCLALALACSSKSSVKGGSGGGGNAGAAGGGGVGGSCTVKTPKPGTGKWPDSFRQYCTDDKTSIPCAAAKGTDMLQDGFTPGHQPTYAPQETNVVEDKITELHWRTDFGMETRNTADSYCKGLGSEWRVPSYLELSSLIDYGGFDPAIDEGTFQTPPAAPLTKLRVFWTSSKSSDLTRNWAIDFTGGLPLSFGDIPTHAVRCVREALSGEIVETGCATVSDSRTGLMWKRGVASYDWPAALQYCDDLKHADMTDWRLPSLKEIQTVVETTANPAPLIDASLFEETPVDTYWTSTVSHLDAKNAAGLDFDTGAAKGPLKSATNRVRCVRDL